MKICKEVDIYKQMQIFIVAFDICIDFQLLFLRWEITYQLLILVVIFKIAPVKPKTLNLLY